MLRLALVLFLCGCSFDSFGFRAGQGSPDGSPDTPDAVPGTPDASPDTPDAAIPPTPDAAPPPPSTGIAHAHLLPPTTSINVNGNLNEWSAADWYSWSGATATHLDDYTGGAWAHVVTVQFAVYYTTSMLYMAFQVDDDTVRDDSTSIFNDDSTEVYLDTNGDASGDYDSVDHYFVAGVSGGCVQYNGGGSPNYNCASQRSGNSYSIEVAVPLLDVNLLPRPASIGFGVGVNDDDGLPNAGSFPDDWLDGYIPWFMATRPECTTDCCAGSTFAGTHTEPWCDTTRLGTLIFSP